MKNVRYVFDTSSVALSYSLPQLLYLDVAPCNERRTLLKPDVTCGRITNTVKTLDSDKHGSFFLTREWGYLVGRGRTEVTRYLFG